MRKLCWSQAAVAVIPLFYVHCSDASAQAASTSIANSSMNVEEGALEQVRLREIINRPLVHDERFVILAAKWENEGLSDGERVEMQAILSAREAQNVERVEAVGTLSELTGVPFMNLWKQLVGEPPALLVPRNG